MATLKIKDRFCYFTHDNSELLSKCIRGVRGIHDHLDTMNNYNSINTCKPVYVDCDVHTMVSPIFVEYHFRGLRY